MREVGTSKISTRTVSSMIIDSTTMTVVECPRLLQGEGHTCLGGKMIGAPTAANEEFQSTPESHVLMQGLSLFKVWLIGTKLTEKATIEIIRLEAGCTFQDPSVSAEPSEQQ